MSNDQRVREATQYEYAAHCDNRHDTRGYFLEGDNGFQTFFTVTEPDYRQPKGTLVYVPGTFEIADVTGDFVEKLTDDGFRVIVVERDGAGHNSRDADVGGRSDILHVDGNWDRDAQALTDVVTHLRGKYDDLKTTPLQFVSSDTGVFPVAGAIENLPYGSHHGISMISPTLDFELRNSESSVFSREKANADHGRESTVHERTWSGIYYSDAPILEGVVGDGLESARSRYQADQAQSGLGSHLNSSVSVGYFNAIAAGVREISQRNNPIARAVSNGDLPVTIIYDPQEDHPFSGHRFSWDSDGITGGTPGEWVADNSLGRQVVIKEIKGGGVDPHYNHSAHVVDEVLLHINTNFERASGQLEVVNALKDNISDVEWNRVPLGQRQLLQRNLEKMGYSVGPSGIDGKIRHGNVADTEHAIAKLFNDIGKTDLSPSELTPQGIMGLVQVAHDRRFSAPQPVSPCGGLKKN